MKKSLLATVSVVPLAAITAASAADLPIKAPPPMVAAWSWAGPYIGFNVGAGRHSSRFYDLGDAGGTGQLAFGTTDSFYSPDDWGITLGGQAGYNWQFGNVVAGIEADLNWLDGRSSATLTPGGFDVVGPGGFPVSANADLDWFGTVRGRLGWAFSRTLLYATGGLAVAHVSNDWGFVGLSPRFSFDETRTGWVAGGGIEYMLTRNWTVRVEGLFADFGTSPIQTINGFSGNYQSKFTNTLTVVRGGLNWKW